VVNTQIAAQILALNDRNDKEFSTWGKESVAIFSTFLSKFSMEDQTYLIYSFRDFCKFCVKNRTINGDLVSSLSHLGSLSLDV
jgi:hypothetical protein